MKIKVFKTLREEEEEKWMQMANQTVNERMSTLLHLQRQAYPDTFDPITGIRKPLEHRITIKKLEKR